ncbi:MAG: hypothetical protein OEU68_01895 [Nitrospira sp.]|nr:hypothetical protein [Nitrospira sp.]MDH4242550.1 hypothetical protein [Nitrospira sp.]MDH4355082.1 hypothetical protein [Nitrospira sp.]MDH5317823.1 hypothetical protein [Nitrospira sp.]
MSANEESALVLTIQTALTGKGQDALGNRNALALTEQLLAFARATVTVAQGAIRVEGYEATGDRLVSYELEVATGSWRRGQFVDHKAGTVHALRVPTRKAAPTSWVLPQEETQELCIYLNNGTLLRASVPLGLRLSMLEARTFWGDLFWLQPEDDDAAYWEQLASFGLPQQVSLEAGETGATLVEIAIIEAKRGAPGVLDVEGYRMVGLTPLHGEARNKVPEPGVWTYALGAGSGEHIGWIIAPSIIKEVQQLANEIAKTCGEFDQYDSQGGLILDWYDRAAKKLGTSKLNAFTRVRELLKSAIALHILPSAVNKGEIPPEMDAMYGQWLKNIFADKKVEANQRWCTFLNGLEQPPPEFGGTQPTAVDHKKYRQKILLELVDDVLQERFAGPVVDRQKPYNYSCWAFDFDARGFKMKLQPGSNVLKTLDVTAQGLRLDVAIERVTVDFEYETQPSGSVGNVALCFFTFGAANIVEIQSGNATVVAKDVLLSLELVPTQVGKQIKLEAKLGSSSHANISYGFHGSNIFTLGMTEVLSAIFTLANAFEGDLLDEVGESVEGFIADLDLRFPDLFNFEDAPAPALDTAVVVSNPGKAQLIGARITLPADRAPTPLPALTLPTCAGDFAITLATDYLNGVAAYRLSQFKKTAKALHFDWRQHLSGESLPNVTLPGGYNPPAEGGKYPTDYEETDEEWTVGTPVLKLASPSALPGLSDAVGTIHIPITYRLTRTHYAWGGIVRRPEVAPEWWWMGLKGPLGPELVSRGDLLIDLDHIMTARYGMYRQADGQIVSPVPPDLTGGVAPRINPSLGWHAVDVGGVIVEWYPYAVSTDEHINVQLEATLPAHLNLAQSLSFLPTLDLTYGTLQVMLKKATYSASFPDLQNPPSLFPQLVQTYLQPFAALHPFQKTFQHPYANAWLLCNDVYVSFASNETPVLFVFTVDTMLNAADSQKLHIERDGARLQVTFRFLESLVV